jgi:hypothetical protein
MWFQVIVMVKSTVKIMIYLLPFRLMRCHAHVSYPESYVAGFFRLVMGCPVYYICRDAHLSFGVPET